MGIKEEMERKLSEVDSCVLTYTSGDSIPALKTKVHSLLGEIKEMLNQL